MSAAPLERPLVVVSHPPSVQMLAPGFDAHATYADRRGLFARYRSEQEMLFSLAGIGNRLRRSNPLHRVGEIWSDQREPCRVAFGQFFPALQNEVDGSLNRRSTMTGS